MEAVYDPRNLTTRSTAVMTIAFCIVALAVSVQPVHAAGQLWLYPDTDDPRQGGHVVDSGDFTLVVENGSQGGGKHDLTAYDVFLVFSVTDPALFDGGSLVLPGGGEVAIDAASLQFGTPTQPCSGRTAPPHGVYPASFTTVSLGDIAAGDSVSIDVEIEGGDGLEAHFDAIGIGYKQTGQGLKCFDIVNPAGHDVSVVFGDDDGTECDDLEISKTANVSGVEIGDEAIYEIVVSNPGDCEMTGIEVVDEIPTIEIDGQAMPAFSVIATDPPADAVDEFSMTWIIDTLAPDEAITLTATVVFDEEAADDAAVWNTACVAAAESDKRHCDREKIVVGEASEGIGGPGFWCNQIRFALSERHNAQFSIEEFDEWLMAIDDESAVISEFVLVTSLDEASDLLCHPHLLDDAAARLSRHLLTLWFNVASETVATDQTLGELCSGDITAPPEMDPVMTVGELLEETETALLDAADDAVLNLFAEIIDWVNNARIAGEDGCGSSRRGMHRRRH